MIHIIYKQMTRYHPYSGGPNQLTPQRGCRNNSPPVECRNKLNSTKMSIGTSIRTINFQIAILIFCMFNRTIEIVKRKKYKSQWESHFWRLEIHHTRPTTGVNELWSFVSLWQTCKIVEITPRFTFKLKLKKHTFTYATVNGEIWRAKTCHNKSKW